MNRYTNRFLVRVDDIFTRITVFDQIQDADGSQKLDNPDTFLMLNDDARQLAEIIGKTLAQHEEKKGTKQ